MSLWEKAFSFAKGDLGNRQMFTLLAAVLVKIPQMFDIPILHTFLSPKLCQWKGARKHLLNGLQAKSAA